MPRKGLLITGTDTGVGKTLVACGLASGLRRRGIRVAPFKPAETGCALGATSGEFLPADAVLLREACQTDAPLETICPYRFQLPVAPWVAAKVESREIDTSFLAQRYEELAATHDLVIVETAGGILVPLADQFHYGDLACLLDLPVLVVAGSKLGVINHTLLTLEYLRHAGLRVAGCVLNHPFEEQSPATDTNLEALRKLAQTPLFVLPRLTPGDMGTAARFFDGLTDALLAALSG